MNNEELEQRLRAAQGEPWPAEHWEEFPRSVIAELRRREAASGRARIGAPGFAAWRLRRRGWAGALALALVATGAVIWRRPAAPADADAAQFRACQRYYHEVAALFPRQLRGIVFDEPGPRLDLAETPDVPVSPPFYLRVCTARGCHSVVTFSGQSLRLDGESFEVLADAAGHVLLLGEHGVWGAAAASSNVRLQVRPLTATL